MAITDKDLLQVGKAIHDKIKSDVDTLSKVLSQDIQSVKALIPEEVGKHLQGMLDKRLGDIGDLVLRVTKSCVVEFEKKLEEVEDKRLKDLDTLKRSYEDTQVITQEKMLAYEAKHLEQLQGLKDFLTSLPLPQVIIPESAIKFEIDQKPSQVNVTMPEVRAPDVHVNLPESAITVNVPELKLPQVNVQVPQARKLKKNISYDEFGRPSVITEVDT